MKYLNLAALCFFCTIVPTNTNAFEMAAGDTTFSVTGRVITYYINTECDSNPGVVSGAVLLCSGKGANSVSNGYLPTSIEFGIKTTRGGYDISAGFDYESGLDANKAINLGGDTEANRIFLTIGNDEMGTILAGRFWGLYGLDATLEEMSLIGVGATASARSPLNTQLGTAGYGYIFTDRPTQLTYTFPSSDVGSIQIGIYQPFDQAFGADSGSEEPGVHGRFRYNFGEGGFISSSFLTQSFNNEAAGISDTSSIVDVVGKVPMGDLTFVGSYYSSKGVGHTVLFLDSHDGAGKARDSDGYFTQLTYKSGDTTYGINYGVTNLDATSNDELTLLKKNEKLTIGFYHDFVPGVKIMGEYSNFSATSHLGADIENDVFNVGIGFFF